MSSVVEVRPYEQDVLQCTFMKAFGEGGSLCCVPAVVPETLLAGAFHVNAPTNRFPSRRPCRLRETSEKILDPQIDPVRLRPTLPETGQG